MGKIVEKDVDRLLQRALEVDPAVTAAAPVLVFARVARQAETARGKDPGLRRDSAGVQSGQGATETSVRPSACASPEIRLTDAVTTPMTSGFRAKEVTVLVRGKWVDQFVLGPES